MQLLHVDTTVHIGQKTDVWFAIDPVSGDKLHTYSSSGDATSTCSLTEESGSVLHIARTGKTSHFVLKV